MAVIVDTDVFSFFVKNDTRKNLYKPHLENQFLFISFMTYAELRGWQLNRGWGSNHISKLDLALKRYSIQNSTALICETWAEIIFESRTTGRTIAHPDAWIAATAISLDIPLISHNSSHFINIKKLNLITENK